MALPASRSQIDALGERLRAGTLRSGDQALLEALLKMYRAETAAVVAILQAIKLGDGAPLAPTSRVKTLGTLVEKLVREKSRLSGIRDIAGVRITVGPTLAEQDRVRDLVVALFPGSRIVARRVDPRSGYRAVHVIVPRDDCWAEIQIRTQLQHLWAEAFERLADRIGRQIRYGEDPPTGPAFNFHHSLVQIMMERSAMIERVERLADWHRLPSLRLEARHGPDPTPDEAELERFATGVSELRSGLADAMAEIRVIIERQL